MRHDMDDIPRYDPPKKNERIEYWNEDRWMKTTITSSIRGYGGGWYNVIHEDGNVRGSVRLHRDSTWRYEDPERRDFYLWRWSHLDQDQEDKNRAETAGEKHPREGVG